MQARRFLFTRLLDFDNEVGRPDLADIAQGCAGRLEFTIGEAGSNACPRFDYHGVACCDYIGDGLRRQGNAKLAVLSLARNADQQGDLPACPSRQTASILFGAVPSNRELPKQATRFGYSGLLMSATSDKPNALAARLISLLGDEAVFWKGYDLRLYEYDAALETARPETVVFPTSTEEVAAVVKLCNELDVPFTARGAGTGLSGGAIPARRGVLVCFTRMNRILEVDEANLTALVEPGVVNLHLSEAVRHLGLQFVPDPSSQRSSTIGGNVGENSGGPHTLAYGVTTNHVLGLEAVMPDGEVVWLGGKTATPGAYDFVGVLVGSEGMLALVTKVLVRLVPLSEHGATLLAAFDSVAVASKAVSAVIAAGIVPAALEMMDRLATQAIEASVHAGYPDGAGGVLLVDFEGFKEEVEESITAVAAICRDHGALQVREAASQKERALLWAGRKGAFGAMGRLSPNFYTMDGVVPRTRLTEVLNGVDRVSEEMGLPIANVFHAGDGNIHPLVLFDEDEDGVMERVHEAARRILELCTQAGGSLTGEHGIGLEKQGMVPLQFSAADVEVMRRMKLAFDPRELCNPGKMFPTPGQCLELTATGSRLSGW